MVRGKIPGRPIGYGRMGCSKKFRRQHIDIWCQGKRRSVGQVLFGLRDESFYYYPRGQPPIVEVGYAVSKPGKVPKPDLKDISELPVTDRIGLHISLHPSGEIHLRNTSHRDLLCHNIGKWLPVRRVFRLASHVTPPIGKLPEIKRSGPACKVQNPEKSLKLRILIGPIGTTPSANNIWYGVSPDYVALVEAEMIPPQRPLFIIG